MIEFPQVSSMHMNTIDRSSHSRLLLFGTRGIFSRAVLEVLLARGQRIAGIFVAGGEGDGLAPVMPPDEITSELPLLPSFVGHSVVEVGWRQGIPVWEVRKVDEGVLEVIRDLAPDAIGVACWPEILPVPLLGLSRWGCLNTHPSMLPAYRGPAPLFWQVRDGLREIGVTIHRMSSRLDEGPIMAQRPLRLPAGATGADLDHLTAELGGNLLGEVLDALGAGNVVLYPQPRGGSYQGWPEEKDFEVPLSWPVERAWNFMRATYEWGIPYTIWLPSGQRLGISPEALYRPPLAAPDASAKGVAVVERGEEYTRIAFNPGVLSVPTVFVRFLNAL
jgi:methionyl-tRNA formyltransferase